MRFAQRFWRGASRHFIPAYREEWRNLCFTLEQLQGQLLDEDCHDKYAYAHTYKKFGQDYEKLASTLRQCARQGDYSFFVKRGVPKSSITLDCVDELIRDWHSAIVSKQVVAARRFEIRFGEDIDVFLKTHDHRDQIASAESLCGPSDAIVALEQWATQGSTC